MKLLAEISDKALGVSDFEILGHSFQLRKSARAVLRREDGAIAIQYLANHFFHKLPGGGVEPGESIEAGLLREIKEEVGCNATIVTPVGMVLEFREQHKILHMSYCYVAQVQGAIGHPSLEQAEIDEGMETVWITPEEAISRMKHDTPNTYQGPFILKRELAFLNEYLEMHKR